MIMFNCPDFSVDRSSLPAPVFRHCNQMGTDTTMAKARADRSRSPFRRHARAPDPAALPRSRHPHRELPGDVPPSAAGSQACSVTLTGTFGARLVTLNGTGVLPPHQIDVTPTSIDFGDVRKDAQSDVSYDIRNTGSMPLDVSAIDIASGTGQSVLDRRHQRHHPGRRHGDVHRELPSQSFDAGTRIWWRSRATRPTCRSPPSRSRAAASTRRSFTRRDHVLDARARDPNKQLRITNTGNIADDDHRDIHHRDLQRDPARWLPGRSESAAASFGLAQNGGFRDLTLRYTPTIPRSSTPGSTWRSRTTAPPTTSSCSSPRSRPRSHRRTEVIEFGPVCAGSTADMPRPRVASLDGGFTLASVAQPGTPFGWAGAMSGSAAPTTPTT